LLSGATLVKPNLETAGRMYVAITNNAPMPLGWPHMQEAVDSVGKLLAEHMSCSVLITQGECGMTLYDPMRGPPESLPGMVCPVADAIGAGDSVLACLAVNLAGGASMREAVLASNVAGCLAVRAAGVQQVQLGALVDEIFRFKGPDSKIVDFARAGVVSKIWRDLGHSVVFTNGCFDMLHYGHMHLLREAKKQGHRLVVGLNSDASVSRLKGKNRPKVSSLERARALADLPYVDLVVVFAEDTPESLVRVVKPLVLVKGADYYGKKVAGESEVVGNGGRLVLIPSLQGISTTEILGSDEFMKT
jgi:D-beta-D-heptose 7-phosphate kinase/D-beta-D-heptose 1-phosphate adenosyltransferase